MAADGGVTSTRLAKDLDITERYARRLIHALRDKGKLYKTEQTDGRTAVWKDVK
jgi:CTP-dependent riboflavin kinase